MRKLIDLLAGLQNVASVYEDEDVKEKRGIFCLVVSWNRHLFLISTDAWVQSASDMFGNETKLTAEV